LIIDSTRSEIRIEYHITTCHLELNIAQQLGVYKKKEGFKEGLR
jgi:hypothetical protein